METLTLQISQTLRANSPEFLQMDIGGERVAIVSYKLENVFMGSQGPVGPQGPAGVQSNATDQQVLYNDAGVVRGDSGLLFNKTTKTITIGGATVTVFAPVIDATQTWNAAGVAFTGLRLNVIDQASAAGSLLADLQVGGTSKFSVRKDGVLTTQEISGPSGGGYLALRTTGSANILFGVNGANVVAVNNSVGVRLANGLALGFGSTADANTSPSDVFLYRDAAGVLALRNGANAQQFNVYSSYTDASNYARLELLGNSGSYSRINAAQAGTGTNLGLILNAAGHIFAINGTSKLQVDSAGTLSPYPNVGNDNAFDLGTSSYRFRNGYFGTAMYLGDAAVGGRAFVWSETAGVLSFGTNGTSKWKIDTSGNLLASTDNAYDIGASGVNRPRTGYFGTSVSIGGNLTMTWGGTGGSIQSFSSLPLFLNSSGNGVFVGANVLYASNVLGGVGIANGMSLGWSTNGDPSAGEDVRLWREAVGVLAMRNGASAQVQRWYETYTDASNYSRAFVRTTNSGYEFGGESAGTATARSVIINSPTGGFFINTDPSTTTWRFTTGLLSTQTDRQADLGTALLRFGNGYFSGTLQATTLTAGSADLSVSGNTSIFFQLAGVNKWFIASDANFKPIADNAQDIGDASTPRRIRTGYFSTAVSVGAASPLYSFHALGGGMRAQALATPAAPSVTPTGVAGTTAYSYFIVANDRFGNKTLASAVGTTATGNAALSAGNFNALSWTAVPGAASYDVLKSDTGHSIALGITTTTFNDTGIATSAYTAPTRNATADITIDGIATIDGVAIRSTGFYGPGFGGTLTIGGSAASSLGTAIGLGSNSSSSGGTAIGASAVASGNATALGNSASATGGTGAVALGSNTTATGNAAIALGYGATCLLAKTMVVGNATDPNVAIADAYFGSGYVSAAPQAFTLHATGGSGTDIIGANITIAGGQPTGAGVGGSVFLATALAGTTGTTLRTLVNRVQLDQSGNLSLLSPGTVLAGYNLNTDASNYERWAIKFVSGGATPGFLLSTENAGTGVARDLVLNGATGVTHVAGDFHVGRGSSNSQLLLRTLANNAASGSGVISFRTADNSSLSTVSFYTAGNAATLMGAAVASGLGIVSSGHIGIYTSGKDINFGGVSTTAPAWSVKAAGHLFAGADNAYDIGATAANRPRNVYVGSSIAASILNANGATAAINLQRQDTSAASWNFTSATGDLNVFSNNSGLVGNRLTVFQSGGAELPVGSFALKSNTGAFYVYNLNTDASNYERSAVMFSANVAQFFTQQLGTGVARELRLGTTGAASLTFYTANALRWEVDATGNFLAGTDNSFDIGAVGATRPRTGYFGTSVATPAVAFPATQVASADPNTLDDYEEGTFTPSINFAGVSTGITYTVQIGNYTKIGNVVDFNLHITLSAKGAATGQLNIAGLPFPSNATANNFNALAVSANALASITGSLSGKLPANATAFQLTYLGTGTATTLTNANVAATTDLIVSGTYCV